MKKQKNLNTLGEVDVIYKYHSSLDDRPKLLSVVDTLEVLKDIYIENKLAIQEQFLVIYLNRSNVVIGWTNMFLGAIGGVSIDTRLIISAGLKLMASGVIISHNHPSGNVTPSKEDDAMTKKLRDAMELLDIKLLDHVIISPQFSYYSYANEGMI